MSFFNNSADSAKNVDEAFGADSTGSKVWDSGVYQAKCKYACIDVTKTGLPFVKVSVEVNGTEKVFSLWTHSGKTKDTYYIDKDNNKKPMPGMQELNALCYVVTGKTADTLEKEGKVQNKNIKMFDWEKKGDVVKELATFVDLCDQPICVAVKKVKKHKTVEKNGEKVPTTETFITNEIAKYLSSKGFTAKELYNKSDAVYATKFKEQNTGKIFEEKLKVAPIEVNGEGTSAAGVKTAKSLFDD